MYLKAAWFWLYSSTRCQPNHKPWSAAFSYWSPCCMFCLITLSKTPQMEQKTPSELVVFQEIFHTDQFLLRKRHKQSWRYSEFLISIGNPFIICEIEQGLKSSTYGLQRLWSYTNKHICLLATDMFAFTTDVKSNFPQGLILCESYRRSFQSHSQVKVSLFVSFGRNLSWREGSAALITHSEHSTHAFRVYIWNNQLHEKQKHIDI